MSRQWTRKEEGTVHWAIEFLRRSTFLPSAAFAFPFLGWFVGCSTGAFIIP
jgi:hypothetical protein